MAGRLSGKVAIVTGSTSGIGEGIAKGFAREGARVVVSGRRRERGEIVVAGIRATGGEAVFQQTDTRSPEDCRQLCGRATQEFGGLDILVNNAGVFPRALLEETTAELWDEIFEVNVRGAFLCAQAAIPLMRLRGGGSIINIGSCNAFRPGESLFAYGTSKSALYALTMNLARVLARDRIRANWITVGWVLTEKELEVQLAEGRDPAWLHDAEADRPMGQYNTVEDNVEACVYLASDAAARVTGANLNASAGMGVYL